MALEIRTAKLESADGGKLAGYAAVFSPARSEDLGGFIEEISPGAFDASIESGQDIRALWNHDSSQPLARTSNGTLVLGSDKRGLKVEISLPENVSYANDLRELVRQGVVNQMSFGFMVPPGGDSWEQRDGQTVRTLHKVDLREISAVSIPAYPDTTVALRSLRAVEFENKRARWLNESGHRAASVLDSAVKRGKEMLKDKMEQLKKLAEERAALVEEIRALAPEDQAQLDTLVARVDELDTKVAEIEAAIEADPAEDVAPAAGDPQMNSAPKAAEVRAKLDQSGERITKLLESIEKATTKRSQSPMSAPNYVKDLADRKWNSDRKLAMRGWFLQGSGRATDEHRQAAQSVGVNLNSRDFNIRLFDTQPRSAAECEQRGTATLVAGTGSLGGYSVPTTLVEKIEKALLYFNPLRQVSKVLRTETGETLNIPFNDDTSNKGELLAEGSAVTVLDTSFSQIALGAYTMNSKVLKLSWQLLEDNAVDLESYVGDLLGERLGRIMADYCATGTGSSQPAGVASASAGKTTASATAITAAEILDLIHSVDFAYRQSPGAALMMHDSVWLYVRKLLDGQNRPLFTDGTRTDKAFSPTVYGFPVIINNSLNSAITTGLKTMVFGDFSNYFLIRDVANIRLQRLDELYAANGAVGFMAWARTDSKILHSGAIKHMVQA